VHAIVPVQSALRRRGGLASNHARAWRSRAKRRGSASGSRARRPSAASIVQPAYSATAASVAADAAPGATSGGPGATTAGTFHVAHRPRSIHASGSTCRASRGTVVGSQSGATIRSTASGRQGTGAAAMTASSASESLLEPGTAGSRRRRCGAGVGYNSQGASGSAPPAVSVLRSSSSVAHAEGLAPPPIRGGGGRSLTVARGGRGTLRPLSCAVDRAAGPSFQVNGAWDASDSSNCEAAAVAAGASTLPWPFRRCRGSVSARTRRERSSGVSQLCDSPGDAGVGLPKSDRAANGDSGGRRRLASDDDSGVGDDAVVLPCSDVAAATRCW